jgi:regulator of RNase E activity RraA
VHVVDFSRPVTVAGMRVVDGDVIHCDQHGAVVIPRRVIHQIRNAAALVARRERVIINAAKQPGFDIEALRAAQHEAASISDDDR